jgi:hypothetical protein
MNQERLNIIYESLHEILGEQQDAAQDEQTDEVDVFTIPQQKFLASFAIAGAQHLGIIYSISEVGIREFIERSGSQFSCTPAVLLSLLRGKYIRIVPYTGYGRNTDYTIELRLPLDAVEKYKDKFSDSKKDDAASTDMEGAEPLPPAPDLAHVVKYGDLLKESVKIANKIVSESKKKSSKKPQVKIHKSKSRILQRVPAEFIFQLKRVIDQFLKKTYTKHEQERLIADIIDNLQVNFKLSDKQIRRAYEFHRNQKRLQKFLDED